MLSMSSSSYSSVCLLLLCRSLICEDEVDVGNDDTEDHKLDDLKGCDLAVSLPLRWVEVGEDNLDEESRDV